MLRNAMLALVLVAAAWPGAHAADAPVALFGKGRPEAAEAVDHGALPRATPLEHILVQMAPPAERAAAARKRFVAALNS